MARNLMSDAQRSRPVAKPAPAKSSAPVRKIASKPKAVGAFKPLAKAPVKRQGSFGPISSQPFSSPAPISATPVSNGTEYEQDSGYLAQLAALKRALADYSADDTAQRTKYNADYGEATKNLGWRGSDWDLQDVNTASGRANQNQVNDFAGRGMLQSSVFATANDNLLRTLNDQLTSINKGRTDFLSQRDRELSAFKNENTLSAQQARAEAIARRAAGLVL